MKYARGRYFGRLLAATLILIIPSVVAHAKLSRIYSSGYWNVLEGTDNENALLCELGTTNKIGSWGFGILFFPHSSNLLVSLFKNTWEIPAGTKIPVILRVGHAGLYTANANGKGHNVFWLIPKRIVGQFAKYFSEDNHMTIAFEKGNEPPWRLSLDGSAAALSQFVVCMKAINAAQSGSAPRQRTQPFNAAPTQPFASPAPHPPEPQPKSSIPRNNNTPPAGNPPSYQHV